VNLRIAATADTFSPDARDAARLAREAGFGGLLFDAYSNVLSIPDLSHTGRREFRHVLSSHELELVGLQGDLGPKGLGPGADLDRAIDRIDRAMEAAAGLASRLICLDVGPLAEPARPEILKPVITPEQAGLLILPTSASPARAPAGPAAPVDQALLDSVNSALTQIGIRADRYGVTMAFRSSLASFAALGNAVTCARCPWFGVDLDPVAMLCDDWDADEFFSHLGYLIRHVRARDAVRGADRRTKPTVIGAGSVEWDALLARLDQSGYHGWITIDPVELSDRAEAARHGLERFRKPGHAR
jgi:sugar phosphate isomerase/epimerase